MAATCVPGPLGNAPPGRRKPLPMHVAPRTLEYPVQTQLHATGRETGHTAAPAVTTMNQSSGLGLFACVGILVGGMIGSAIFSLSGLTIYQAGAAAMLSWALAALVMLVYGLVAAELSSLFPRSGGVYVFPSRSLGKTRRAGALWGWMCAWGDINTNIAGAAFSAIFMSTYLGAGFGLPQELQIPIAIAAVALCFGMNVIKFTVAGVLNSILVADLVVTLLVYAFAALADGQWDAGNLTPFFTQGADGAFGFLNAVPTAMVGYGAVVCVAFMVSEVRDPKRTVPRAVAIAMAIVVVLYVTVIAATIGLVSPQYLADNPDMRYVPLYAACYTKLAYLPWLPGVVSVAAVLSLLTTILILLAQGGRTIQAAAQDGLLPQVFAKTGRHGTPVCATAVIAVGSAALSCFPNLASSIVNYGALFAAVTVSVIIASVYAARKKSPEAPQGYRVPRGKVLPALALVIIVACYIPSVVAGGFLIWLCALAWYGVGYLVFRLSKFDRTGQSGAEAAAGTAG